MPPIVPINAARLHASLSFVKAWGGMMGRPHPFAVPMKKAQNSVEAFCALLFAVCVLAALMLLTG
jgi:hypothetical protein